MRVLLSFYSDFFLRFFFLSPLRSNFVQPVSFWGSGGSAGHMAFHHVASIAHQGQVS